MWQENEEKLEEESAVFGPKREDQGHNYTIRTIVEKF